MAEAFLTNQNYSLPALINLIYPIGSIYLSVNSTSPQQLFGGEWEQIKDKFLLSAGDTYSSGSEGGEATHTLTNDEMPAHRHTIYMNDVASDGEFWGPNNVTPQGKASANVTDTAGGNQPHNNMPPYIAVYVWKRTA